jgi:hypothetical protein
MDRKVEQKEFYIELLGEHRRLAHTYPLNVLVWGASKNDPDSYKARCDVRDILQQKEHNAYFSEDLCKDILSLNDSVYDEILQARSADAIVVVYESRGTQTEVERILIGNYELISKTIVIIQNDTLSTVQDSLSGFSWKTDIEPRSLDVIKFEQLPLTPEILEKICVPLEGLRQKEYVKKIMYGANDGK